MKLQPEKRSVLASEAFASSRETQKTKRMDLHRRPRYPNAKPSFPRIRLWTSTVVRRFDTTQMSYNNLTREISDYTTITD